MQQWQARFEELDHHITMWMARHGIVLLRISVGVVFFWFGVLKFFPSLSPAEDLASETIETLTFGLVQPALSMPILALWECAIGIGLITGRYMRFTLLLLAMQMLGTTTPLLIFPDQTWHQFPIALTLEGQYILKNVVLVSAAIVIGATVRGGDIVSDPDLVETFDDRFEQARRKRQEQHIRSKQGEAS